MPLPGAPPIGLAAIGAEYKATAPFGLTDFLGKPGAPTAVPVSITDYLGLSDEPAVGVYNPIETHDYWSAHTPPGQFRLDYKSTNPAVRKVSFNAVTPVQNAYYYKAGEADFVEGKVTVTGCFPNIYAGPGTQVSTVIACRMDSPVRFMGIQTYGDEWRFGHRWDFGFTWVGDFAAANGDSIAIEVLGGSINYYVNDFLAKVEPIPTWYPGTATKVGFASDVGWPLSTGWQNYFDNIIVESYD